MRFITAMLVSANLALSMQGLSIESTCEDLIKARPLNADLASTIKWKLENQACISAPADSQLAKICSSPVNIQENRIQNVKPVPHKTDDADAFWGQFQNHRVELRPYKGVVLEKYSCSLLQDFVCGLGFDWDYCELMHAQKAGCRNVSNSTQH
ncbi:hypothetical protein J3459_011014 [Metarhizium acridum]|uniref:uncharacterized protein n=1 Tax=Metarhizium acridum TaxID=92637 RepID=UPI001C6BBE02|nr:hypothetical protein J3458_019750 [Metarhizium acridum]KAG8420494.1 hypothetical protein J3459_011014 [Metarhizium acridum]